MSTMTIESTEPITVPAARLVLPAGASKEEWHAQRSVGVGASDVSAILELDAEGVWGDRHKVWTDKTGRGTPWEPGPEHPAYWGNVMEPVLRAQLALAEGVTIHVPGVYASTRNPLLQCTPDGIHVDPATGELVLDEFKHNSGYGGLKLWADDKTPMHPLVQVQFSMHLLGIKRAIIFALAGGTPQRREIEYDPEVGEMLEQQVMDFWNDYIVPDIEPDPSALSLDRLAAMLGVADPDAEPVVIDREMALKFNDEYHQIMADERAAKKKKDGFNARMRLVCGNAGTVVYKDDEGNTIPLFTLNNDSTFKKVDFADQHPDKVKLYSRQITVFDPKLVEAKEPKLYREFRARSLKWKGKAAK